jgi:hypothetical protein
LVDPDRARELADGEIVKELHGANEHEVLTDLEEISRA